MRKTILYLFVGFVIWACTHKQDSLEMTWEKAAAIMLDVAERNRNFEKLTERDDTLMRKVVALYKECGKTDELMEAYYLLGSVYRDLNDAPKALASFMEGISAADTLDEDCNYDMLTKLYTQKVELMDKQKLYKQAAEEEKSVFRYAMMAGDTLFALSSLWSRLGTLYMIKDYQTASDECNGLLEKSKDWGYFTYAAGQLLPCVLADIELQHIEKAQASMEIYEMYSGDVRMPTYTSSYPIYYYTKGRLLTALHELDSAETFFRRELAYTDWNNRQLAYRGLHLIYSQKEEVDSALKYSQLQCEAVDSDYQAKVTENLQTLHELYDYSRVQKDSYRNHLQLIEQRNRMQIMWWILGFIIFAVMAVCCGIYIWHKKEISKAELELELAKKGMVEQEHRIALLHERLANARDEMERKLAEKDIEVAELSAKEKQREVEEMKEKLDELRKHLRLEAKSRRQEYHGTELFQSLLYKARNRDVLTDEDCEDVKATLLEKDPLLLKRLYDGMPAISRVEEQTFLLLRMGLTKSETATLIAHSQQGTDSICNRMFKKAKGKSSVRSAEAYNWILEL